MDLLHAWALMGWTRKGCFLFVVVVSLLALVRTLRVAMWIVSPSAGAAAGHRVKVERWARSTRGHAQTALWFMAAAGLRGLADAYEIIGTSARPMYLNVIEDSVHVFDASAVGLGLCAALFAMVLVFDVAVQWGAGRTEIVGDARAEPRPARVAAGARAIRRAVSVVGLLLIATALADFGTNLEAGLGTPGDSWMAGAAFRALGIVWERCGPIAASVGMLTWLAVLVENRQWNARH